MLSRRSLFGIFAGATVAPFIKPQPNLKIYPTPLKGAVFDVTVENGRITAINMTNPGSGYTVPPTYGFVSHRWY